MPRSDVVIRFVEVAVDDAPCNVSPTRLNRSGFSYCTAFDCTMATHPVEIVDNADKRLLIRYHMALRPIQRILFLYILEACL